MEYGFFIFITMGYKSFDSYATEYDSWFIENCNVLESEVKLVASCLKDAGDVLSIGCGSGLFEKILADQYGIFVSKGIEPSISMAEIARKRGIDVIIATGEEADYGIESYDTILFNGCPCYMQDFGVALSKAYTALRHGGKVVVIDVPKESAYGLIYNLALSLGTWEHPLLEGCTPLMPYPIELVKQANWRTTAEKIELIKQAGFNNLSFAQTLIASPHYSHEKTEEPCEGFDKGSYVAITAYK
jgi:SAM-dependent methyltransferase